MIWYTLILWTDWFWLLISIFKSHSHHILFMFFHLISPIWNDDCKMIWWNDISSFDKIFVEFHWPCRKLFPQLQPFPFHAFRSEATEIVEKPAFLDWPNVLLDSLGLGFQPTSCGNIMGKNLVSKLWFRELKQKLSYRFAHPSKKYNIVIVVSNFSSQLFFYSGTQW